MIHHLPTLPTKPISRPEFNRRCKAAGLFMDPDPDARLEAIELYPDGRLIVTPKEHGPVSIGANKPVVFASIRFQAPDSHRILARLESDRSEGWEQVDPASLKRIRDQLEILFSPAEISLPRQAPSAGKPPVTRGRTVRIVGGKESGVEGEAFWVGPNKFGDGERVGVKAADGQKHWAGAEHVEVVDEGRPFWTPLHQACSVRDFERVEAILRESTAWLDAPCGDEGRPDASFSSPHYRGGTRPIHIAVVINALETVALLIEHGADVNVRDTSGSPPLHFLGLHQREICQRLLDAGAEIDAADDAGETFATLKIRPSELNKTDSREVARELLPVLAEAGADLSPLVEKAWAARNYVLVDALAEYGYARADGHKNDAPVESEIDFSPLLGLDLFEGEAWLDERDSPTLSASFLTALPELGLPKGGGGKEFGVLDALRWLETRGGPVDCPWVIEALDDKVAEVARAAAVVLRVHDREAARREALTRLTSPSAATRALAVEALGDIGDPSTIPDLLGLEARETGKRVKRALKKALRSLQT